MSGSRPPSMFAGLSMLRAEERKKEAAQAPKVNSAMQEYLKKYADGPSADGGDAKPKKKKKPKAAATGGAIKIIDEDGLGAPSTRKPPTSFDDEEEDDEYRPVVANEAEARLLVKQMRQAKNFYGQGQDGSGWVASGAAEAGPSGRGGRHDSPDASPPRRGGRHDSPDASPPRRARHDSPDASPPRRPAAGGPAAGGRARHDSPDASPPRRARHDSPDASPPRRPAAGAAAGKVRHDSPDASPPRRGRHDSPDASPPRRPAAGAGAAAAGGRARPDASPPRRGRHDSPDASPPRRGGHDSPDASPPRRGGGGVDAAQKRGRDAGDASPPRRGDPRARMADGTAAGLVSARELAAETERMKAEMEERRRAATGRGEQTVYRDRATGKVVSRQEFAELRQQRGKQAAKEPAEEVHLEWKGGLAQKRAAEERVQRMREEAAGPFARGADDRDREAMLRERLRFGDPMAHLVRGKARSASAEPGDGEQGPAALTDRYDAAALKQSGFQIPQGVPAHSWLKRGVAPPANRYNIRPGRHWDGVDRSNGYEKEMFKYANARAAQEHEARLWSMSDL